MTDILSLFTIGKTIAETIKTTKEIFDIDKPINNAAAETDLETLADNFVKYQNRMGLLATQIYQCEALTRFIPMWLVHHDKFDCIPVAPSLEETQMLDIELRTFLSMSITDQFSGAFFRTNYDKLPQIEKMIDEFRRRITEVDRDMSAISSGRPDMLKMVWGVSIKADLFRLRRDALGIVQVANQIFEEAINELRQTASV